MAKKAVSEDTETPQYFPMSLREYAVNVKLDPLWEAGLGRWVTPEDRLQTDWDALLEAYKVLPIH